MLRLHLQTPAIFPQWSTLFCKAPQFSLSNHGRFMFKNEVILKLFFQFCSPRAYDLGFERDAAEDLCKVNNRDKHEGVENNR